MKVGKGVIEREECGRQQRSAYWQQMVEMKVDSDDGGDEAVDCREYEFTQMKESVFLSGKEFKFHQMKESPRWKDSNSII